MKGMMQIPGSTAQMVPRMALRLHPVADFMCEAGVDTDLDDLYDEGDWYCLMLRGNGTGLFIGQTPDTLQPPHEAQEKMLDVAMMLNRDLHHMGHWIVVWRKSGYMCLVWRDNDAALQFDVTCEEPWVRVKGWADTEWTDRAEVQYTKWAYLMGLLDLKPEQQTIKPTPSGIRLLDRK